LRSRGRRFKSCQPDRQGSFTKVDGPFSLLQTGLETRSTGGFPTSDLILRPIRSAVTPVRYGVLTPRNWCGRGVRGVGAVGHEDRAVEMRLLGRRFESVSISSGMAVYAGRWPCCLVQAGHRGGILEAVFSTRGLVLCASRPALLPVREGMVPLRSWRDLGIWRVGVADHKVVPLEMGPRGRRVIRLPEDGAVASSGGVVWSRCRTSHWLLAVGARASLYGGPARALVGRVWSASPCQSAA
jgi:hypothetical protein